MRSTSGLIARLDCACPVAEEQAEEELNTQEAKEKGAKKE
jgi:hypothetical protein